jgi:transposase
MTSSHSLSQGFSGYKTARAAMEIGTDSPWVSRLLTEPGHDVLVADARKVRAICTNEMKSDRVDAETLARIPRVDPRLLSPIRHRDKQFQADLAVLRPRDTLVRSRRKRVNPTVRNPG